MLEDLDLDKTLSKDEYQRVFPPLQERLRQLQYDLLEAEIPTVVVFEGWDASGKGTIIRHLTEKLDPRAFRAWPGAPPSDVERRYHFLWRYETRLPEDGHIALFDHSWYGRVLVDRVERWVKPRVWKPAYEQINQLERWLTDDGQVLVKLWFHISKKEQRRRLRRMEEDPAERWRVEKEDWRRNERYADWLEAAEDMLARTETPHAGWTLVEATDARFTRVKAFQAIVRHMEEVLARRRQSPAAVSRTHGAEAATRVDRARRDKDQLERARTTASEAGMPLEDAAFWTPGGGER